jgi:hypothetical protein
VRTVTILSLAGALLMLAAVVFFIQYDRDPPGGTYIPAHMENGEIVPGHIVAPPAKP